MLPVMAAASGEALRDPWGNTPLGLTTALSIHRPKLFPGYGCLQCYRGFCYIVGGVISPLLANVYLHYVLDAWFEQEVKPRPQGPCLPGALRG